MEGLVLRHRNAKRALEAAEKEVKDAYDAITDGLKNGMLEELKQRMGDLVERLEAQCTGDEWTATTNWRIIFTDGTSVTYGPPGRHYKATVKIPGHDESIVLDMYALERSKKPYKHKIKLVRETVNRIIPVLCIFWKGQTGIHYHEIKRRAVTLTTETDK